MHIWSTCCHCPAPLCSIWARVGFGFGGSGEGFGFQGLGVRVRSGDKGWAAQMEHMLSLMWFLSLLMQDQISLSLCLCLSHYLSRPLYLLLCLSLSLSLSSFLGADRH